jgi:hypothetical protein
MDFSKSKPSTNFMDRTAQYAQLLETWNRMRPLLRADLMPSEHILMMLAAEEAARERAEGYPPSPRQTPGYKYPDWRRLK